MSDYLGEGQFTRVYRGAYALSRQDVESVMSADSRVPVASVPSRIELAIKLVKMKIAHREKEYILSEVPSAS